MEDTVSFIAVGDVLLDGRIEWPNGNVLHKPLPEERRQPESAFYLVSSFLKKADFRYANLEGPLCDLFKKGTVINPVSAWSSDSRNVTALKFAGFDLISLATNIMMCYGWDGAEQTIRNLRENGIDFVGAGNNLLEATQPKILRIKNVKIAFLDCYLMMLGPIGIPTVESRAEEDKPGLSEIHLSPLYPPPHLDHQHLDLFKEKIKEAKSISDIVVVSCHWGVHSETITVSQSGLGHIAIDCGADLVIGTHPHNIQAIEVYKNKVIAYSMGSFAFDIGIPLDKRGLLLEALIFDKRIQKVSFRPVLSNSLGQPELLGENNKNGAEIFRKLESLSQEFGTKLTFRNGEISLG